MSEFEERVNDLKRRADSFTAGKPLENRQHSAGVSLTYASHCVPK